MTVVELNLDDDQAARLDRFAGSAHKSLGEATAQLIEEALRHEEFPAVEFRDSIAGRQAYVAGSGLAVWEVLMIAETYGFDANAVANHLEWPLFQVEGVIAYYRAYSAEIDRAVQENDAITPEEMKRSLPNAVWID